MGCVCQGMASSPQGFNHQVIALPPEALTTEQNDFALDIGGSLAKIAYYCTVRRNGSGLVHELHLVSFSLNNMDASLHFIRNNIMGTENHRGTTIRGTGVGCTKFKNKIQDILDVRLEADPLEVEHAVCGIEFLWRHLPLSQLLHGHVSTADVRQLCPLRQSGLLPCLVVNIGSAVTMLKVDENGAAASLVGGSALGGLTFLGLGSLLTGAKTFRELLELAERGNHKNVDLLLRDTAGDDYNHFSCDAMISHFGRVAMALANKQGPEFKPEDIAASLLLTITSELAQTTYLVAKTNGIHNVCLIGSFLQGNHTSMSHIRTKLAQCSQFLQYEVKPTFLRYESYLGAIGVLVDHNQPKSNGELL